jgi:hypothetical protein
MDETTCLHAGSLIIPDGMACLNLSCDGSHYKPRDEFLEKSPGFWPGTPAFNSMLRSQNGHREFRILIICIMAAR